MISSQAAATYRISVAIYNTAKAAMEALAHIA